MPLGRAFVGFLAGEVVTVFRFGLAGFAWVSLAAYHHDAAGAGKADGVWFYRKGVQVALLNVAMSFVVLGKKGGFECVGGDGFCHRGLAGF